MFNDDDETEVQPLDDSDRSDGIDGGDSDEATLIQGDLETQAIGRRDAGDAGDSGEAPASDVELAEETIAAPSFPAPVADRSAPGGPREFSLEPGDEIGDFEILELLGRGAFGAVYMARQVSLDRRVALKITENQGSEGRTMARLEHANVVQVFSEEVDPSGRYRLLCMQLAPGASLDAVIRDLRGATQLRGAWNGEDYLASIDDRTVISEAFDPSALRDRELLGDAGDVEVASWVGARLAEAINFAHANGVLHRDIKPANVLINQYGRPMLADFNIAFRATGDGSGDSKHTSFGGTMAYMAPEHLEAFDPRGEATADDVDERSDIYALGIVIYEVLCGVSPFDDPKREVSRTRYVGVLTQSRRVSPAPIDAGPPSARKVLQHTIAKSLAAEKEDRYQSGEQLAAALDGCQRLAEVERKSPPTGSFVKSVIRRPLLWAMLLIFLPQVIGSIVNIQYNANQIVTLLDDAQRGFFVRLVTWYNALVYPAAFATLVYFFWPVFRTWQALSGNQRLDAKRVNAVRRASLRLPIWVLIAAAVGWLPGGILFPALINQFHGPIDSHIFGHFLTSFTVSGLIAVAYSFCGMQYVVMRVLYPRLWTDATSFREKACDELSGTTWRIWFCEIAANTIPLVAAALLLVMTDESGAIPLRRLVFSLVFLGVVGTTIVRVATGVMSKIQVALTGDA